MFPSTISYPSPATSPAVSPRTLAFVASGTNAGVSIDPCGVSTTPARAAEPGSRAIMRSAGTD